MDVDVRVDKLNLSSSRGPDVFYPMKKLPFFKFSNYVVKNGKKRISYKRLKKKGSIGKYLNVIKYRDPKTGNILLIGNQRKSKSWAARPLYLIFYPCFPYAVKYSHVRAIEQFFHKECGVKLQISIVHFAVDLIDEGDEDLYRKVINSIKPGFKSSPYLSFSHSKYFGKPTSSNQLLAYDKTKQLRLKKGIIIPPGRVRVELRLKAYRTRGFPITISELGSFNWTGIVSKHYSFHIPTSNLMIAFNSICESWRCPVWSLKALAGKKLGLKNNFYRDCLIEHPIFTRKVSVALSSYSWIENR